MLRSRRLEKLAHLGRRGGQHGEFGGAELVEEVRQFPDDYARGAHAPDIKN